MNTSDPTRKVHIRTYGCQMNVYDSERMADALAAAGYESVDSPETADLILLNTCHIREKAAEKVYSEIGRLRGLKVSAAREGRAVTIGVAGCVAAGVARHVGGLGGPAGDGRDEDESEQEPREEARRSHAPGHVGRARGG